MIRNTLRFPTLPSNMNPNESKGNTLMRSMMNQLNRNRTKLASGLGERLKALTPKHI
jgi:hypothetical protein